MRKAKLYKEFGDIALKEEKNFKKAISYYSRSLDIDPSDWDCHYSISNAFINLKKYSEASDALKKCLALNPTFSSAHCTLGINYLRLGNIDSALFHLNHGIPYEQDPNIVNLAKASRGCLRVNQGKYDEAITDFEDCLNQGYEKEVVFTHLACCYYAKNKFRTALNLLEKAIMLNDKRVEYHVAYLMCFKSVGEDVTGFQLLDTIMAMAPEHPILEDHEAIDLTIESFLATLKETLLF